MSTKAEGYIIYLTREGYLPEMLPSGDVRFKVQGESLVLTAAEDDPSFFKLSYYHKWNPEETEESWNAINLVNGRVKVVKVCIAQDVVFLTTEALLANSGDFELLFPRYIQLIGAGIQALREALALIKKAGGRHLGAKLVEGSGEELVS